MLHWYCYWTQTELAPSGYWLISFSIMNEIAMRNTNIYAWLGIQNDLIEYDVNMDIKWIVVLFIFHYVPCYSLTWFIKYWFIRFSLHVYVIYWFGIFHWLLFISYCVTLLLFSYLSVTLLTTPKKTLLISIHLRSKIAFFISVNIVINIITIKVLYRTAISEIIHQLKRIWSP